MDVDCAEEATNDGGCESSDRRDWVGRKRSVEEEATKVVGDGSDRKHAASHYARKMPAQKVAVECAEETTKVGWKSSDRWHAASHLSLNKFDWTSEKCWLERNEHSTDWAAEKCWRLALER